MVSQRRLWTSRTQRECKYAVSHLQCNEIYFEVFSVMRSRWTFLKFLPLFSFYRRNAWKSRIHRLILGPLPWRKFNRYSLNLFILHINTVLCLLLNVNKPKSLLFPPSADKKQIKQAWKNL